MWKMSIREQKVDFSLKWVEFSENHHFGSQGTSKSSKYGKEFVCFRARGPKSAKIIKKHTFHENSGILMKIIIFTKIVIPIDILLLLAAFSKGEPKSIRGVAKSEDVFYDATRKVAK